MVERLVKDDRAHIKTLQQRIKDKEATIGDKKKIISLLDSELMLLKNQLVKQEEELEASEARFAELFVENDGKDFSGIGSLYPKALEALAGGDKVTALKLLGRHELLEQKRLLDQEKEQQAKAWLLRADLLKEEDNWGEELDECYEMAVDIFASWGNYLAAGNHFSFVNDFDKADNYYEYSLKKAMSQEELGTTLNNLAILQKQNNQLENAEKNYHQALNIIQQLAEDNPKAFLPYLAHTLNNLAVLQKQNNQLENAEKNYQKALDILQQLAKENPKAFLPNLADILNNLAVLQKQNNQLENAEKNYQKALDIRQQLAKENPKAFLPYLANTLHNLANLQSHNNQLENAEKNYCKALDIRQQLAKENPNAFELKLADTYINLSQFYRYDLPKDDLSKQYAQKALTIYQKYEERIPHAKKWAKVARTNLSSTLRIGKYTFQRDKLLFNFLFLLLILTLLYYLQT